MSLADVRCSCQPWSLCPVLFLIQNRPYTNDSQALGDGGDGRRIMSNLFGRVQRRRPAEETPLLTHIPPTRESAPL